MIKIKETDLNVKSNKNRIKRMTTAVALTMALTSVLPSSLGSIKVLGQPIGVTQAHASAFKFGIAPSVFYNTRVAQGSTVNLKVFLANNSELDDDKPKTLKDYTMNVAMTVKCDMAKEEQNKYVGIIQRGIKIKPPIKRIAPNQKDLVDVSITIPKAVEIGEYRYSLVFTKLTSEEDKKKNKDTGNSEILTSIEVPLYLEVYDPANPNKGVYKQGGITDTFITSDITSDATKDLTIGEKGNHSSLGSDLKDIVKDVFKYTFTNFTPKRMKDNWHDFTHKTYKFRTKHKTYIDVADVKTVPITKALAYKDSELSRTKYLKVEGLTSSNTSGRIGNIMFEQTRIIIELEGGSTITLNSANPDIIAMIRKQIENIKKELSSKPLTVGELLDKLNVPESSKWCKGITLHNKLKNVGNITAKPVCNVRVTDENGKEIDMQKIPTHFITPGEETDITVSYKDLSKWGADKYKFETAIAMGSNPANANKVDVLMSELTAFSAPIRTIIGFCCVALGLGSLTLLYWLIRLAVRKLREQDSEDKNDEE